MSSSQLSVKGIPSRYAINRFVGRFGEEFVSFFVYDAEVPDDVAPVVVNQLDTLEQAIAWCVKNAEKEHEPLYA